MKMVWIKCLKELSDEEKGLMKSYGLTKVFCFCDDKDENIAAQAIANYDEKERTKKVNGISLKLDTASVGKAL